MAFPQQSRAGGDGGAARRAAAEIAAGRDAEKRGQLPAALAHYRNALLALPRDPSASLLLGNLLLRAGRAEAAIEPLLDAVRVPRRAEAAPRHLLGLAYLAANRLADARRELQKALKLSPDSADVLKSLGNWAMRAQETAEAERYYRRAIARAPKDVDARLRLAALLLYLGRAADSHALYREILAAGHAAPVVYAGLVESSDAPLPGDEYASIASLAESPKVSPVERRMLHFAAAKLDRLAGRREAEFSHYVAGKALIPNRFDIAYFGELVDALIETVTPDFIAGRADFAQPSSAPIFIFGMPRSSTSLTERILAAHPEVGAAGEAFFLEPALGKLGIVSGHRGERVPAETFKGRLRSLDRKEAEALARDYLALLAVRANGAARITEKTPHNFLHLWLLALLFPRATFIHCVRDPMATCFSCFTTDLGDWHGYTRDLETLGRYYRLYGKLMRHWQTVLPVTIVESRYEDLVAEAEAQSRRLVAAAGLPWDDACLRFHETSKVTQTASYTQVREPIHARRLAGWRAYEEFLGPLKDALAAD